MDTQQAIICYYYAILQWIGHAGLQYYYWVSEGAQILLSWTLYHYISRLHLYTPFNTVICNNNVARPQARAHAHNAILCCYAILLRIVIYFPVLNRSWSFLQIPSATRI